MYMQFSRFLLSKTIHNQRSALFGLCLTSCLCSLVVCKELVFSLTDYIVLITKPFFNLKTSYSFESSGNHVLEVIPWYKFMQQVLVETLTKILLY